MIFITLLTSCSNIGNSFCTHELGEWTTVVEATCETNGKEVQSCNLCGIEVNSREIPKSEHKEGDWIIDKEPTCTEEGHKYKKCTSCGTVVESQTIGKVGHITSDWIVDKEPTCTEEGHKYKKCTECGDIIEYEYIPILNHNYVGEHYIPKCMHETGVTTAICTQCNDKKHILGMK